MVIDRARHVVTIQGENVDLTLSEFELLSFLAEKKAGCSPGGRSWMPSMEKIMP